MARHWTPPWLAEMLARRAAEDAAALAEQARNRRPIPDGPCGAKTRAGTSCKRRDLYANGRCRLHGGLSTGPRTAEGKAKAARNLRRRRQTP